MKKLIWKRDRVSLFAKSLPTVLLFGRIPPSFSRKILRSFFLSFVSEGGRASAPVPDSSYPLRLACASQMKDAASLLKGLLKLDGQLTWSA